MKRTWLWAAVLLVGGAWVVPASALTPDGYDIPYAGVTGLYEFPDSDRDSQNGRGFRVLGGYPLTQRGSIEASFFTLERKRHIDGNKDYQRGLFFDYVYDFGLYGFDTQFVPNFKPYTLGGLGAIQEDVRGHKKYRPGLDLGAGLFIPLKFGGWDWGWGVRAEYRYQIEYNDRKTEGANSRFLYDQRVELGLNIPLTFLFKPHMPAQPAADCATAVVDPATGRRDCVTDSDGDGVADGQDQCPGTPPGTKVDDKGCPSETGRDSDGDGVFDSDDQCPDTPAGMKVDAKGCPISQTAALRGVNFELDSEVLTPDSKGVLDGVARALGAQKDVKVVIGGHTDNTGTAPHNEVLSQQRAEAVRQYLIGQGIEPDRMTVQGFGATQPVATNDNEEGRAANRRVEFKIADQEDSNSVKKK